MKRFDLVPLLVLVPMAVLAQATPAPVDKLCEDSLSQDVQPTFSTGMFQRSSGVLVTPSNQIQLDTNRTRIDPEHIFFPFDQEVSISYVYESAGASHALGFVYVQDLFDRGYLDASGALVDSNSNGIYDLHEDIYNLAPPSGTQARPYIGATRRCGTSRTFNSGGFTYMQPELAVNGSCDNGWSPSSTLRDARPGLTGNNITVDLIGEFGSSGGSGYSDNGLYRYVPNLLEPRHAQNGNRGLGHLVFLNAEDDGDNSVAKDMAPVGDSSSSFDGIPDYDVSNYTADGHLRAVNGDPGITGFDRTVELGVIPGGREVVFFIIVWYDASHDPSGGTVYPCLRKNNLGRCTLHLRTGTNVYFSRAAWNMDQDSLGSNPAAVRNIGCGYDASCDRSNPASSSNSCSVSDTSTWNGQRLCGWLDNSTLNRLDTADYRNLVMPNEASWVDQSPSGNMPHVIVGAPSSDPFRWILGFEDLPGGGDRDFNDVVFTINKINGGGARSGVVSGDISPEIAADFTITKVRFRREDDNTRMCGSPAVAPCWTETVAGACNQSPQPSIDYYVAVDCNVQDASGNWVENRDDDLVPGPTWTRVPFPVPDDPNHPTTEVELDMLALGFTGSQLCWSVVLTSPDDRCLPTIDNLDVGYQAVRSGMYSRSSPSTLANAIIYGGYSTPGSAWGQGWPSTANSQPPAGLRAYDGAKDFRSRGHLIMKTLYDPENTSATNVVQRWDSGRALAISLDAGGDPLTRRLFTTNETGVRIEVSAEAADDAAESRIFPDSLCDQTGVPRDPWDMNNDGECRTATHPGAPATVATASDRTFFREWLYGWEDRHDPAPAGPTGASVRQQWPIGGVKLSTVNLAIPPFLDAAARQLPLGERDHFTQNFMSPLQGRPVTAFVGTTRGLLHAFNSGELSLADDSCTPGQDFRGHFEPSGSCGNPTARRYGNGQERFAYLPRGLLDRYVNSYASFPGSGNLAQPTMDASATVANVDFEIPGEDPWTINDDEATMKTQGAKTVLLSSTGKDSPVVFGLDITDPSRSWYPYPLWEYAFDNAALTSAFSTAAVLPDNAGSRHAPSVGRMAWGTERHWMAAFATDYQPNGTRAGTVYLMDMKEGAPKAYQTSTFAGVVTLDPGFGIGGEPALVDVNEDGTYETLYVPSTSGKVYRLNLTDLSTTRGLGNVVSKCVVADAPADLAIAGESHTQFQQIHSNLSVKVERGLTGNKVRIFFGTGDNPDDATDGPDAAGSPVARSNHHWHLMAYEDLDPLSTTCTPVEPLWVRHLDNNQAVWGGVMLTEEDVFVTTAVGASADVCSLSEDESGRLYTVDQIPDGSGNPIPNTGDGSALGGHGVNAPIVHDGHLFVMTADGKLRMVGDNNWNNQTGTAGGRNTQILIWQQRTDGSLPR